VLGLKAELPTNARFPVVSIVPRATESEFKAVPLYCVCVSFNE